MTPDRLSRLLRPFVLGTGGLFLAAMLYEAPLEDRFVHYPRQAFADHMIAYHWKSVVIYITPSDNTALSFVHATGALFALVLLPYFIALFLLRRRGSR